MAFSEFLLIVILVIPGTAWVSSRTKHAAVCPRRTFKQETAVVNGLHMFIVDSGTKMTYSVPVFYSRRYNGPYYRWSYEQKLQGWRSVRVQAAELPHLILSVSPWKDVPGSLRNSLRAHYVE